MVLIEPETKTPREQRQTHEVAVRREVTAEKEETPSERTKGLLRATGDEIKNFFKTVKAMFTGVDVNTVGMTPEKKVEHYLKKSWHHMARNEIAEARDAYDKLVNAYEELEESKLKTNVYYEVHDIYQRLAEIR